MSKQKKPILSFEWKITSRCNYRCSYCGISLDANARHCSDETVQAVFRILPKLKGSWLVKLIGGEPLIHPRFFQICEKVISAGHTICLTTNFSLPFNKLQRLIKICGNKLIFITASLHLAQIKNIEDFFKKAVFFRDKKHPATDFSVTSVVTENNFRVLKALEKKFHDKEIKFAYQILKLSNGRLAKYSDEIEAYIQEKTISNTAKIRDKDLFNTLCYTGKKFFTVELNGDVHRCYSPQPGFYLGNVTNGSFKLYSRIQPCLSHRCICTVPANRNMIIFGRKSRVAY